MLKFFEDLVGYLNKRSEINLIARKQMLDIEKDIILASKEKDEHKLSNIEKKILDIKNRLERFRKC